MKLSKDVIAEETGGFIRLAYLEKDGSKTNELFLSEKEAKKLSSFLENYDYSRMRYCIKLRH